MTMIRFLQTHTRLARLVHRGPLRAWIDRRVWAELSAMPGFDEELRRAEAELAAGRGVRYEVTDGFLHRMLGRPETWT